MSDTVSDQILYKLKSGVILLKIYQKGGFRWGLEGRSGVVIKESILMILQSFSNFNIHTPYLLKKLSLIFFSILSNILSIFSGILCLMAMNIDISIIKCFVYKLGGSAISNAINMAIRH